MKIFELTQEIRSIEAALNEWAEGNEGDVTSFKGLDELVMLKSTRQERLLGLGCLVKEFEAEAEAIEIESKKLRARADARYNHAERLRKFISGNLVPGERMSDSRVSFAWRKSEGVVIDESLDIVNLPSMFKRVSVSPDKAMLKDALKAGNTIDGVTLESRIGLLIK